MKNDQKSNKRSPFFLFFFFLTTAHARTNVFELKKKNERASNNVLQLAYEYSRVYHVHSDVKYTYKKALVPPTLFSAQIFHSKNRFPRCTPVILWSLEYHRWNFENVRTYVHVKRTLFQIRKVPKGEKSPINFRPVNISDKRTSSSSLEYRREFPKLPNFFNEEFFLLADRSIVRNF